MTLQIPEVVPARIDWRVFMGDTMPPRDPDDDEDDEEDEDEENEPPVVRAGRNLKAR